ncbi:hypothetical protein GQ53DRAFT_888157 [Thozetella sp. PMI_491]|nr:hypothetical protein GQ53DRAFT_888157 [Thozetella sp. PMI_491]
MASFVPTSSNVVRVRAIDTTTNQVVDAAAFIHPVHKGQETLNLPTLAFLIENEKLRKKVLFDCGGRKDFRKFNLGTLQKMDEILFSITVEKDVDEILTEAGIALDSIDSMIWSHWHWDHHGAPDQFPTSVEIVVGPGFKELFMPGFPTNPDAILADAYFEGREVREVTFADSDVKLGSFPAFDYFGDGSFYLLDSPGHAVGHICALARTTPDTFVFMGGDICHSPGIFRPTKAYPLSDPVPSDQLDPGFPLPCPCSLFTPLHPSYPDADASRTTPFFGLSQDKNSTFIDDNAAKNSIEAMRKFEESPNVLVCISHDMDPEADINNWKAEGLKEKARWFWLNELPRDGKPGRPPFVEGRFWMGRKIDNFSELIETSSSV